MTIDELLDTAKKQANIASDYALAKVLGIQNGIVANWRKGKRHPSNEEAVKLATLAKLDEMTVIAEIEMRTANNDKKRDFWRHYIESRGVAAVGAMMIIGAGLMLENTADANVLQLQDYDEKSIYSLEINNIHYANFT